MTHWRGQHSFEDGSLFLFFLEFATFLVLVPGQEVERSYCKRLPWATAAPCFSLRRRGKLGPSCMFS